MISTTGTTHGEPCRQAAAVAPNNARTTVRPAYRCIDRTLAHHAVNVPNALWTRGWSTVAYHRRLCHSVFAKGITIPSGRGPNNPRPVETALVSARRRYVGGRVQAPKHAVQGGGGPGAGRCPKARRRGIRSCMCERGHAQPYI